MDKSENGKRVRRSLDPEDTDLKARWIRVRNKPGWRVKTRRARTVPIFDEALRYLAGIPKQGRVFAKISDWGDVSTSNTEAGFSLQILRHSWVTHLLGYVNPNTVADWAGHDLETQQARYAGRRQGDPAFRFHYNKQDLVMDGLPAADNTREASHK